MEFHKCFRENGSIGIEIRGEQNENGQLDFETGEAKCKFCGEQIESSFMLFLLFEDLTSVPDYRRLLEKIQTVDNAEERIQVIVNKYQDMKVDTIIELMEEDVETIRAIRPEVDDGWN